LGPEFREIATPIWVRDLKEDKGCYIIACGCCKFHQPSFWFPYNPATEGK
jgi:hypothetical protein